MSSHGAVDSVSQMDASTPFELGESYDAFPRIEEEFQAALDESLILRGPDLLFGLVGDLRLPAAARVIDVGCGEGRYALELAERFGFVVRGIDPMESHLELAGDELATATSVRPELRGQVSFELGTAEALPVEDASVDLVWCRDVLVHVRELDEAYAEFRRVLRDPERYVSQLGQAAYDIMMGGLSLARLPHDREAEPAGVPRVRR